MKVEEEEVTEEEEGLGDFLTIIIDSIKINSRIKREVSLAMGSRTLPPGERINI